MRFKIASLVSVAACCVVLASCGGGDDTSTSPTPTPTPTSTGTPTPTPTPTPVDFDFTKAFQTQIVGTSYSFAYFTPASGAEVWSDGSRRDGLSSINYAVSPESVVFDWPDSTPITSFAAADLLNASATLRTYRKGTDGIVLELPFDHVLRVAYESVAPFVRNTVSGTLRSFRYAIFFNNVTTTAEITANLTYTGTAQVAGGLSGTTPFGVFSSAPATMTVTSSDKKINGTIRVFETVGGSQVERAALPISATLATNGSFSGAIDDTANAFKGSFAGTLAGPTRQEVVILFNVAHTDGREFIGSYIGG